MTRRGKSYGEIANLNTPKIIECGFGCGSRIYKNKELNVWLEEWTDRVHDRLRCEAIQEKKRREEQGDDVKAPRLEIVEELRHTLIKLPVGTEMVKQLYELIKTKKEESEGVTRDELALALYPNNYEIRKDGSKRPRHDAITSVGQLMSKLRKWKLNMAVAPFSKRFRNGVWYYYNMQTQDDFKPVLVRRNKQRDGIEAGTKKAIEIINSGTDTRSEYEKEMDMYLKQQEEMKKRKKNVKNYDGYQG